MAVKEPEQTKFKEELLREELRVNRTQMLTLLQWGVTVLSAVELNLYYIRRDATKHLVDNHAIIEKDLIPFPRWFIGTLLLCILALVFSYYMRRQHQRHVSYRKQLIEMKSYSGIIEDIPTGGTIGRMHYLLFFIFPAFDVFVWGFFYVGERLQLTIW